MGKQSHRGIPLSTQEHHALCVTLSSYFLVFRIKSIFMPFGTWIAQNNKRQGVSNFIFAFNNFSQLLKLKAIKFGQKVVDKWKERTAQLSISKHASEQKNINGKRFLWWSRVLMEAHDYRSKFVIIETIRKIDTKLAPTSSYFI